MNPKVMGEGGEGGVVDTADTERGGQTSASEVCQC